MVKLKNQVWLIISQILEILLLKFVESSQISDRMGIIAHSWKPKDMLRIINSVSFLWKIKISKLLICSNTGENT